MRAIFILTLCLAAVAEYVLLRGFCQMITYVLAAFPSNQQRIIDGSVTTIDNYPSTVSTCGGTLLNNRSILTAAHCTIGDATNRWRVRIGSTWANSGGVVHNLASIISHPSYNRQTLDSDLAVLHTATTIDLVDNAVQPAPIANYNVADNQIVWAVGWGATSDGGPASEQLRHVQVWAINQNICAQRYATVGETITANMLCAGVLYVNGHDQCQGDAGGPVYHYGTVVGICSWGRGCAVPSNRQRIVGGLPTTIDNYPSIVSLLYSWNYVLYVQTCAGTLINNWSILTAAHCTVGDATNRWRVRVGSTWANSGGVVHNLDSIIIHPSFNSRTLDNDIAVLHTATTIELVDNAVQPAPIPSADYYLGDNQVVWAAGWGASSAGGSGYEQLHHVHLFTINQNACAQRYATVGDTITANMLCTGVLDVGGQDQCQGDAGGPVHHYVGNVVGICSWGRGCGQAFFPGVNTRVSQYTAWILDNSEPPSGPGCCPRL
ncbi:Trypsin [Operophtera brumata]|uniref:Trypsin n=1 Tax=Operophtera brumata TaxID=104452 RepID=A0A0L7LKX8_OPEBR|nr:Trypsin [Operophtera brumata]